mmetsp:Transcript_5021/g.9261  ORF Transcript_5021/g.9261 Transcript_5021/m.9261 type:complete len:101 (-) Transcript_5021:386-688(-)
MASRTIVPPTTWRSGLARPPARPSNTLQLFIKRIDLASIGTNSHFWVMNEFDKLGKEGGKPVRKNVKRKRQGNAKDTIVLKSHNVIAFIVDQNGMPTWNE